MNRLFLLPMNTLNKSADRRFETEGCQSHFRSARRKNAKMILRCLSDGPYNPPMSANPQPNRGPLHPGPLAANPNPPVANPGLPVANANPLVLFNQEVIGCHRCSRLRRYCEEIATSKRRAYRDWIYWAKPVPSFGDEKARVLVLGLAPGAHGSNRTGRPFTGDGSGDFLYPVLYDVGFASQPSSVSRGDGMKLHDCWISSVVRCAPPDNAPTRSELGNCAPYVDQEIALLTNLRVVVCLGRIAFDGYVQHLARTYKSEPKPRFKFSHGAEYALPGGRYLIASFHPSLQNTNTGKLTRGMLFEVFERARGLANAQERAPRLRR
jgi:uracil-DNA glycosylase family 4